MAKYNAPDGFNFDETTGKYFSEVIANDADGKPSRIITYFDAETGEYSRDILPAEAQPDTGFNQNDTNQNQQPGTGFDQNDNNQNQQSDTGFDPYDVNQYQTGTNNQNNINSQNADYSKFNSGANKSTRILLIVLIIAASGIAAFFTIWNVIESNIGFNRMFRDFPYEYEIEDETEETTRNRETTKQSETTKKTESAKADDRLLLEDGTTVQDAFDKYYYVKMPDFKYPGSYYLEDFDGLDYGCQPAIYLEKDGSCAFVFDINGTGRNYQGVYSYIKDPDYGFIYVIVTLDSYQALPSDQFFLCFYGDDGAYCHFMCEGFGEMGSEQYPIFVEEDRD